MDLVAGNTIWTNINKISNKYTYLSEDIECDVVIIGAGITGAICAYHFAKAGVNTVIVDKNIIGYGSTSASTSILQYEIDKDLTGLAGLIGIDRAVECFKMCENAVYDIENIVNDLNDTCGFHSRGCFYYTDKETDIDALKKEYELRKNHGFNVEFLNEKSAKQRFTFPVKAGIYSNIGAGEIDPYRFAHGLISKSIEKGLNVFENTQVVDIQSNTEGVTLVTNNQFDIKAKKVIIATGFEAKKYMDKNIAIMTRSFTIVTKPVKSFDGWYDRCIIRDNTEAYTYIRTTDDDRIIIGGEDMDLGGERSKMSQLSNHDPISLQKYEILKNRLQTFFPNIQDIEVEYCFSGLFAETKDGLPYIGEYEGFPNCYFCLGYGSNGILYAILGAQLLKELYFGNYLPILDLFRFNR